MCACAWRRTSSDSRSAGGVGVWTRDEDTSRKSRPKNIQIVLPNTPIPFPRLYRSEQPIKSTPEEFEAVATVRDWPTSARPVIGARSNIIISDIADLPGPSESPTGKGTRACRTGWQPQRWKLPRRGREDA